MPTTTGDSVVFHAPVWTTEYFERSVKHFMDLDSVAKPPQEMREGVIILEGDIRCKIKAWDRNWCVVRYGKNRAQEVTLERRFMNFKYAKEKSRVVTA